MSLLHFLEPGRNVSAAVDQVKLVGQQNRRGTRWQQRQHLGVSLVELAGLNDKHNQVHVAHSTDHGFIQRPVQRIAVPGLETGGIDKHILGGAPRMHAGDAVPRGLCLARGDADLLPDQGVEQGRFANVGLADDGNHPAALTLRRRRIVGARGHGFGQHGFERCVLRGHGFFNRLRQRCSFGFGGRRYRAHRFLGSFFSGCHVGVACWQLRCSACFKSMERFYVSQHDRCRRLLTGAARTAHTALGTPKLADLAFHVKSLFVGGTQGAHHPVNRQVHFAAL